MVEPLNTKFTPRWNDNILQINTIGGPVAIVLHKSLKHITLDPRFIWFLDLDLYYRLYKEVGPPVIYDEIAIIGRIHDLQLTNTVCKRRHFRENETRQLILKYGSPLPRS
jgi:hypothetical protein